MTDTLYIVYKCPEEFDEDEYNPYFERGVYPTGEVMGVFNERENAEERKENLEDFSPSKQYGETMDDAPYSFYILIHRIDDEDSF